MLRFTNMASLASDRADYPAALRYATARTATEPQTAATAAPRRAAPPQQCAERSAGIGFSKSDSVVSAAAGAGVGLIIVSGLFSECCRKVLRRRDRQRVQKCTHARELLRPAFSGRTRTHARTHTHTHSHSHSHTLTHTHTHTHTHTLSLSLTHTHSHTHTRTHTHTLSLTH